MVDINGRAVPTTSSGPAAVRARSTETDQRWALQVDQAGTAGPAGGLRVTSANTSAPAVYAGGDVELTGALVVASDGSLYRIADGSLGTDDDFTIQGTDKAYRFRKSGELLDLEATGAKLLVSNWSGTAFNGTQRTYMVFESGAQILQLCQLVQFRTGADGTTRHSIDGTATTGGVVINEDGQETDLRVEGGTDANLLVVDGSADRVGIGIATPGAKLDVAGSLRLSTAGSGMQVAEGANATMGVATLVAGTATVATTAVTADSRIMLTAQVLGTVATPVALAVTDRTAGTSFVITSANGTDTSTVAWLIVEPA